MKSGGHSSVPFASNIEENGVTIDLSSLNDFSFPETGRDSVVIGAGWRWDSLYSKLAESNLSIVGGRVATLGVSGYLLGGGLSFYSSSHGWASNSILSYEVVLSNSTILNISSSNHADAFWALKGSNFLGIVTKFEVETRELEKMLFGSYLFDVKYARDVYQAFIEYCIASKRVHETTANLVLKADFGVEELQSKTPYLAISHTTSPSTSPPSPILTRLFDAIPSLHSSISKGLITEIIPRMEEPFGDMQWKATLTLKSSFLTPDLLLSIQQEITHTTSLLDSSCKGNKNSGYLAFYWQPLGDAFTTTPNDVFGLYSKHENENEVPIVCFFQATWTPRKGEGDSCIENLLKRAFERIEKFLEDADALHRFRYQNYASETQIGYEGYGEENLERLRGVRERYGGIRDV